MRISLVSDWTWPRVGGVEHQVQGLAHQLLLRGHDVRVITFTPGPSECDGVPYVRLATPVPRGWRALQRGMSRVGMELGDPIPPLIARRLEALIADADIVHAHSLWSALGHVALKQAHGHGVATVMTNHSLLDRPGLIAFRAIAEAMPWPLWPDLLTAPSTAAARATSLAARRHVHVVPNGLDTTAWAYARTAALVDRDTQRTTPRLVSVLRLNARKSPQRLVDAYALVREALGARTPPLEIFGDGPLRGYLEARARAAGLDGIAFRGWATPREMAERVGTAALAVLPGSHESFGISAAEALAAGVPVVGMRSGGMTDVVMEGGVLVESVDAMAREIVLLLTDELLRVRLAAGAPRDAARFDWEHVAPAYVALYETAVRRREPAYA